MKKSIYILLTIFIVSNMFSCKDQDAIYKEFVELSGQKYPQKADSLKVLSGYNRLKLTWLKAMDPSVVGATVYWNSYTDSLTIDLTDSPDTVEVNIPDLIEGTYTFYVNTFDKKGNFSITAEATGSSYGDNYFIALTERAVEEATRDENYTGIINWGALTSDLVYTEVRYKNTSGSYSIVKIPSTEKTVRCPDAKPGEKFEYRSRFLPVGGIDTVSLDWVTYNKPFLYLFPRNTWTANARNGNHEWGDGGGGFPYLVLDGNTTTGWHSRVGAAFPQVFVIDTKESSTFTSFKLIPPSQTNWRYLVNVEVYISDKELPADAPDASWGTPAVSTVYDGSSEFSIELPSATKGRYIALVFPNSKEGSPYISFMEFYAYGY